MGLEYRILKAKVYDLWGRNQTFHGSVTAWMERRGQIENAVDSLTILFLDIVE
jgi:hypothetical protein